MSSVGCSHSSREDVCVCGRRHIVDAQQSTPAQHHEPSGAVMCDEPSATSEPPRKPHASAKILSRLPAGYATWASIWIPRLPWRFMFPEQCLTASCFHNSVQPHPVLQSLVVSLVLSQLDYGNTTLDGLPGRELNRLQSVLNAAAWLIFAASKYDHVTPLLRDLHLLQVPEHIDFKITVLIYRCLHGLAPAYLSTEQQSVKDLPSRQRLQSWSLDTLTIPTSWLSTVVDRAFPVIVAQIWNTMPAGVISSTTLPAFKRLLKSELFSRSFPDVL